MPRHFINYVQKKYIGKKEILINKLNRLCQHTLN